METGGDNGVRLSGKGDAQVVQGDHGLPAHPPASTGRAGLVQLRARLTLGEYAELRVIAVRTRVDVADLVAHALRGCYPLSPDAEPSVRPATTEGDQS